ncbi:RNA polymerase sigma factor [Pedobacter frigidisoli]|uniref:RNA polymerase sigma factor n=1 Tax=Pedobacter frigidisoli TaxID=2530455 RepID=UPI002930547F|nr:sigma-70 family RNA polymerase sigma factor [Pedobacter frigidisoli]
MAQFEDLTALWEQVKIGNETAFSSLHGQLYQGLFIYTLRIVEDEEVADDLLQDLFVKFWQNRAKMDHIYNIKAYFYKSIRCMTLNYIRNSQLKESKLKLMPEPELIFSKEDLIMKDEFDVRLKHEMHQALNNLPGKQREVLYMRFYENLEYDQIADIIGIKYQSVINHVYRGIQILREVKSLSGIYAA